MTQNRATAKVNDTKYIVDQIDDSFIENQRINNVEKGFLISVVIPLYNEEKTITNVIERIPNHHRYEIIIVDDGSTDNSVKRIREIHSRNIKIIKHEENHGYGAAILTGVNFASGEVIVTLDSDGQHNPEEIPSLIRPIIKNEADLVIGSRYLGACNYKNPLYARVGAYFINLFLRLLYFQKVADNQCGFRAFKKDIIYILRNMKHTGMGFSTEILFKAAYYKYKIVEIPISINSRTFGSSYVNLIKINRSIISCILFYMLRKFKLSLRSSFLKRILDFFYRKIRKFKILT
jgi:glycosyltransferase involved in cell wall biosynthesis